jgi:hypothetical protein
MTTMRGLGNTSSYNGGSARYDGLEDRRKTISLKDLPEEMQAAHELLQQLKAVDPKGRQTLLERAQAKDPITQKTLKDVALFFDAIEMPLSRDGVQQFKAERGLGNGPSLAGPVAKAYARAALGGEVLFRVTADEELALRPADKACLQFLRAWSRTKGVGEQMGRLKEALGLGNPPLGADAAALANEYVGAQTVREVSKASSTKNCPLTPEGMAKLIDALEAEKAKAPAANPTSTKPLPAASPTSMKPAAPATTLPPKFAGSLPAARVMSAASTSSTTLVRPPSRASDDAEAPTTKMQRPLAKIDSAVETSPRLPPKPAAAPTTSPPRAPPQKPR